MLTSTMLNLAALASLVPAALVPMRRDGQRDGLFWAVIALAVAGPALWIVTQLGDSWRTGLTAALWISIAVSIALFAAVSATVRDAWRLAPLLLPYLLVLGVLASIFDRAEGRPLAETAPLGWLEIHIGVSVVAYGLVTMAAVAALAAFLQERALKTKRPTGLTRMLPSVLDSEALSSKMLFLAWVVMGFGVATGMATQYFETAEILRFDHKTLLSLFAFAVIGGLLAAQRLTGVRGRLAARFMLLAYLLLTLAFPGVKFVTGVLIG
ncbi:cytochrome c biogenesis protein CcsA [Telmatospirillum sp. J64-1]|uniref:cytochrome c biogenesis protein CcsA n=1 Tax=Telmatospirillum sp. J64-1 TaxID=2502183 RepID=UPI00115CBF76|nr:cytochrome c biogenesis protein CcsA [Telmatospirillum sp. J64-1]